MVGTRIARSARDAQAFAGRVVEVGEEEDRVETVLLHGQGLHEARDIGPLPPQELRLLLVRADSFVEGLRERVEGREVALFLDRETPHEDPIAERVAGGELVAPGHVVAGAGGEDLHLVGEGQPLRDGPGQRLRAPGHVLTVALDDEGHAPRHGRLQVAPQGRLDGSRGQRGQPLVLFPEHGFAKRPGSREEVRHLTHLGQGTLVFEADPRRAEGVGHRGGGVGQDRHPQQHRLHEGHSEALVGAHGDEDVGRRVAGEQIVVIDVAGEDHLRGGEAFPVGEGLERVEVRPPTRELADEQQPHVRRDETLPVGGQPDHVFLALVGCDAPHEEQVGTAVLEQPPKHGVRSFLVAAKVQVDGQHVPVRANPRLSSSCRLHSLSASPRSA